MDPQVLDPLCGMLKESGKENLFAGLFVALSLANGSQGFDCLSETVYSYLCYGLCSGNIVSKVCDIADDSIREHLLKVCNYIIFMCIGDRNRGSGSHGPS